MKITEKIDCINLHVKISRFQRPISYPKISKEEWIHLHGEWSSRKDYDEDEDSEPQASDQPALIFAGNDRHDATTFIDGSSCRRDRP